MTGKPRPLWAPWRIDYILSDKVESCFLCNRKEKNDSEDDELVISRGEQVFVMLNRYPYNSGHLMVTPYRHIGDISELTRSERYELIDLTVSAEQVLQQLMCPDGFNIGFNLGTAGGAGIKEHIHQHIVPRWVGDTNFMPVLSDTRVVPQALKVTADLLREKWQEIIG